MKKRLQITLMMLGASFGLLLGGMATEAKAAEKIVFMTSAGNDEEIFIMNPDGTGRTNLTNNPASFDQSPNLSKDGTKIVFSSNRIGGSEIYTMNVDGTNVTNVSNNGRTNAYPSFSPDGTKIVFAYNDGTNADIYIMNSDGTNQTRLTNDPGFDLDPSFSPDGTKIVFQSSRTGNYQIYMMSVDGSNQTRLTNHPGGDLNPSFSPDGTKIVFTSARAGNNFDIYIMNSDGTNQTRLTTNPAADATSSFSPDGTKIAFGSARDGNNYEIYIMNPDGTNQTRVTNDPANDFDPSWGVSVADSTPPVITPTVTGTLGNNGWYTSNVQVSWSVTDPESTVSNQTGCELQTVSTDTGGVTFTCQATSAGGTDSQSVTVKRDATAPQITFASRTAPNAAAWNNTSVTVLWSCSDATSGATGSGDSQTLGSEGANQSASGTCFDLAGNSASDTLGGINIDKTAPTLAPTVTPNPVVLNSAAAASPNAADGLSGVASQSCAAVVTSTVGFKSAPCTATDNAGNTANANAIYQVIYAYAGFFQPIDNLPLVNIVTAGQSVPVKFSLTGDQGLNIVAAGYPTSSPIPCDASEPGSTVDETVNAGGSTLIYDAAADQYNYVWKTSKAWKGTCRMFVLKLADGTEHFAKFRFR